MIGGRYELIGEPVAVQWNTELAQQFPNTEHRHCRQEMRAEPEMPGGKTQRWVPFDPPRCADWHCPRCGTATNSYGHHAPNGQSCNPTPR